MQRDDLVNGYTSNAAYQPGREDEIGTIAVGYRADLVVFKVLQDLYFDSGLGIEAAPAAGASYNGLPGWGASGLKNVRIFF